MAKLDEGTRWHWQSPIPPMFGTHREELHSSLMVPVILYRAIGLICGAAAIILVSPIMWDLLHHQFMACLWRISGLCIVCPMIIASMTVIEQYVASRRGPTAAMESALRTICSMSEDVKTSVDAFRSSEMLSFAIARTLIHGNQHLLTNANAIINARTNGPQPSCDRTDGPSITLGWLRNKLEFQPHCDGWYRAAITDARLHRMLCAGAAGQDAGIYWPLDATRGLWATPASFMDELPNRLSAMARMMP